MARSFVMAPEQRQAFLADVHVGVIAIGEAKRGPLAVPVWYSYEPGGDVHIIMGGESRKMVAIRAARRFTLCAQDENPPYKYVSVEGPVASVRPSTPQELLDMAVRYLGEEGGRQYAAGSTGGDSMLVTMTPQRWLSTDYG